MHAIILAGGRGSRLAPLTADMPKPLLRLGQRSILEITLRRLRASGFTRVTLCVSHLGEMICREFGDGGWLGLSIDYAWDHTLLGTAAPLSSVSGWAESALVMNGDILTAIDFSTLVEAHRRAGGLLTVAIHRLHVPLDFGVVDFDEHHRVHTIREKPSIPVDIAAGIQVVDPEVRTYLPRTMPLDMPALVTALIADGHPVQAYPFTEPWHDVGTPTSYEAARKDFLIDPTRYIPSDTPLPVAEPAPR